MTLNIQQGTEHVNGVVEEAIMLPNAEHNYNQKEKRVQENEQVNFAEEERKDSGCSLKFVFAVHQDSARRDVWIGGVKSKVIVDSGGSPNIMSQDHWEQLKRGMSSTNHTSWRRSYFRMGQQSHWPLWRALRQKYGLTAKVLKQNL